MLDAYSYAEVATPTDIDNATLEGAVVSTLIDTDVATLEDIVVATPVGTPVDTLVETSVVDREEAIVAISTEHKKVRQLPYLLLYTSLIQQNRLLRMKKQKLHVCAS